MSSTSSSPLYLAIGGLHFALHIDDTSLRQESEERFGDFVRDDPSASIDLTLQVDLAIDPSTPSASPPDRPALDPAHQPEGSTAAHDYRVRVYPQPNGARRLHSAQLVGHFDPDQRRGQVTISCDPARPQINNYLLSVMPYLLLARDSLILHSSGVIHEERGYVFSGPSNAGKTTTVRNSEGRPVLSDELVILQRDQQAQWWVHGTPFFGDWNENGENRRVPLAGIHFLQKANAAKRITLPVRERFRRLFQVICCREPLPAEVAKITDLAESLLPFCHGLQLHTSPSFWPHITAA